MSVRKLLDLHGRTALITGGSRGLGLQIAEALCELGARVALVARKPDELEQARAHLEEHWDAQDPVALAADLADVTAIAPLVERVVAALGPVDILVNNAGATWGAASVDLPLAAWNKVMGLNLTSTFLVTQEIGRRCMIPRRRGKIVNIASILGLLGGGEANRPATLAYNTSKGGIVNFTRSLAAEWAQYDIHVNAIAPGFFPTKMTKGLHEILGDRAASKAPLNRVGGPEDLKGLAVLFASDACSFITGQIVAADGGATCI